MDWRLEKPEQWDLDRARLDPLALSLLRACVHLSALWEGGGDAYDYIARRFFPRQGVTTRSVGKDGRASTTASATKPHFEEALYAPINTSDGAGTGDFTMLCVDDAASEARITSTLSQRDSSGSTLQCDLIANSTNATADAGAFELYTFDGTETHLAVAGLVDGDPHARIGLRRGTTHQIWQDGIQRASSALTVRDVLGGTQDFALGGLGDVDGDFSLKENLYLTAAWSRALTTEEARLLTLYPFMLIRISDYAQMSADGLEVGVVTTTITPSYVPTRRRGFG